GTVVIALLNAVIQKTVSYAEGLHNDILERYITLGMMDKALGADLELFDNPTHYDKFTSVKRDSYATTYILWNALDCISSFITFSGAFAVLCTSNWLYGVLMVVAAFPSAIAGHKYTKILYRLGLTQINDERKKGYLYEVASTKQYAQDIRLFGIGGILKDRYTCLWTNIFTAKKKKIKARTILTTILEFLPELVIAFITLNISFKALSGIATVGDYSLYTGLLGQLWSAIYMLTNSAVNIYENKLKIDNVKSFDTMGKSIKNVGNRLLESVETIDFIHVSFCYPQANQNALNDINFTIHNGEKLAIVGVNGAGKSTLIKLLLRFYDVSGGQILINGVNIKEYTIDSLHKCFSCYFQNTPNYGFTLRENISIADQRTPVDKEILDAIWESDGNTILAKSPSGLDTYLTRAFEDSGIELSGGQNQKIALARTFYRSSSALILDEPSSSLDPEAEHRLFQSLERLCKGKTTLFTSHRLSNINLADRIVVIENGEVIEIGTREELLKNPQRFAQLYQYQAEKFKT
ncbi:MAG: ABC transporter ATP-binding protein, partial [Oscillospiraceae bacterium]